MNVQQFYQALTNKLDRLTDYNIPLHIRVENQDGSLDSIVDVKDVELYDLSDCGVANLTYGLQITLRKMEE